MKDLTNHKWKEDGARVYALSSEGVTIDKVAETESAFTAMRIVELHNKDLEERSKLQPIGKGVGSAYRRA
jgi:hypothetical protein